MNWHSKFTWPHVSFLKKNYIVEGYSRKGDKAELQLMRAPGRRIQEVAHQEKPDIIHAYSPVLNAISALWAGRKLGISVVYKIRAFWEDAAVDHGTYSEGSWKYNLTKSIETWVCKRADQVVVLCNGLKNDLSKRGISSQKITPDLYGTLKK